MLSLSLTHLLMNPHWILQMFHPHACTDLSQSRIVTSALGAMSLQAEIDSYSTPQRESVDSQEVAIVIVAAKVV
jgi:hypothetical protein